MTLAEARVFSLSRQSIPINFSHVVDPIAALFFLPATTPMDNFRSAWVIYSGPFGHDNDDDDNNNGNNRSRYR